MIKTVESLESHGAEYIDTGIAVIPGRKIVVDFEFTQIINDTWVAGASNNPIRIGYFAGTFNNQLYTGNFARYSPDELGVGIRVIATMEVSYDISRTLYLFGRNWDNVANGFAYCKIYSAKIYEGSNIIADFVPFVNTETNVCGMYDRVSDTYFYNQGGGNFTAHVGWEIIDGLITNENFIPMPELYDTLPDALWRIDQMYNQGFPFNNLMIGLSSYTINPVEQYNYISIYDMWTPQNSFENNGICLLEPISCKVTEQLNGGWEMHLEIPIDEDGKWEYVKQGNYIKLLGQIFTINKVELAYSGNSGKLTAWGEHIFYQLNDPWIPEGTRIVGTTDPAHQASTGNSIIAAAMAACITHNGSEQLAYDFGYFSDFTYQRNGPQVALYGRYKWNGITSGMTLIDFLLGGDGFIASLGGELYRDNFYFSINKRMEHAQDDAFELRAGLNITSIRRTVDLSTYCTYFKAYTDDGYWWAVAWDPSTVIDQYPHNIVREKKFSVNTYGVSGIGDFESRFKMMLLWTQTQAWFSQNCMPSITYVVNVKDLARSPEYSEISMFRFKVGDKGRIYDERYGRPITVQVTRTVTDAITGEVLQVQFGSARSFTRTSGYKPIEESDVYVPVPQAMKFRLKDSMGRFLKDSQSRYLAREVNLNE